MNNFIKNKKISTEIFNDALNISADNNYKKEIKNNNSKLKKDDENKLIYLFNFLENLFNDNKKTIIYFFWKNLKKIKNNFILKASIQSIGKFNSFKYTDSKNTYNQIIIELTKLKPLIKKTRNK